jgi:hypothetical protein
MLPFQVTFHSIKTVFPMSFGERLNKKGKWRLIQQRDEAV